LAVPSLIGSNAARLGELMIGPLLAGMGSARHRWLLGPALIAAAAWQVARPAADLAQANAPPFAPQTAALVRELEALRAETARVEAVPQYGHWESQELADAVPLARGWERQLDIERNPLFYGGSLSPATYRDWLRYNAVRYVALSMAAPDPAAAGEATILPAGAPWLIPGWRDRYRRVLPGCRTHPLPPPPPTVTRAHPPLARAPATVTGTNPAHMTLRMPRAGTTVVRVHWSPLLRADGAVVGRDGPWTSLTARRPGRYELSAPY